MICSWLDIFSLKRRWGWGEGCEGLGRGSVSCWGPALSLSGRWWQVAGIRLGRELGFPVTREKRMGRQRPDQASLEFASQDGGTRLVGTSAGLARQPGF